MTANLTEPLPCPFCGDADPCMDEIDNGVHALVCNDCGCIGPVEPYIDAKQTAERAIELWNRRNDHPTALAAPEWAKEYL